MLLQQRSDRRRTRSAFTLLEVLIVVAIIVMLSGAGGYFFFQQYEEAEGRHGQDGRQLAVRPRRPVQTQPRRIPRLPPGADPGRSTARVPYLRPKDHRPVGQALPDRPQRAGHNGHEGRRLHDLPEGRSHHATEPSTSYGGCTHDGSLPTTRLHPPRGAAGHRGPRDPRRRSIYPSLKSSYGYYKLTGGIDSVRAAWAMARARAVEEGRPYRFSVEPNGSRFRVAPDQADYWSGSAPPTISRGRGWSSRRRCPAGSASRSTASPTGDVPEDKSPPGSEEQGEVLRRRVEHGRRLPARRHREGRRRHPLPGQGGAGRPGSTSAA